MEQRKISELPNLSIALMEEARKRWNKAGPIYFGRKFKYENVIAKVKEYAAMFMAMGIKPHDRIAIMMTDVPQFIFSYYGTLLAGGMVDPINILNLPQDYKPRLDFKIPKEVIKQIEEQIKDSEPKILIALDIFYPVIAQMLDKLEEIKTQVVFTRIQDYLPRVPIIAQHKYRQKAEEKKIWVERKDIPFDADFTKDWFSFFDKKKNKFAHLSWEDFPGVKSKPDDVAVLQYTGGTTGIPKGAMLTHKNLLSNIEQCRKHMGEYVKDGYTSMLAILPFFHVFGMTVAMNTPLLSIGAPLILIPNSRDIEEGVKRTKKHQIKGAALVPKHFQAMGKRPDLATKENLESVELFISGGGPLPRIDREKFENFAGAKIFEGYGLSEASPVVSVCTPDDRKEGSAGKPVPDTEIKIVNLDTNEEIPAGAKEDESYKTGEVVVFGPQVMKGYWQKPKETAEVLKDGWLYTGDIGYIDEDGFLFITDRKKDMVKILGENVYPIRVEEAMASHPYIEEIAVAGVIDMVKGDRLAALVVLNENGKKNKQTAVKEILDFAKQKLPKYEVPKEIILVSTLDEYKNNLGKVLKRKIREDIKNGILK